MSEDEYGDISGDYATLEGVDWDAVLPCLPSFDHATQNPPPHEPESHSRSSSSGSSTHYSCDYDGMGSGFFAEIDALEQQFAQGQAQPSPHANRPSSANSSTHHSYDNDGMNSEFFAEVDSLERNMAQGQAGPSVDAGTLLYETVFYDTCRSRVTYH